MRFKSYQNRINELSVYYKCVKCVLSLYLIHIHALYLVQRILEKIDKETQEMYIFHTNNELNLLQINKKIIMMANPR